MPGFPTKCIGSGVRTPVESTGLRKPETHKPRPFGFAQGKKDPFDFAQDKPAAFDKYAAGTGGARRSEEHRHPSALVGTRECLRYSKQEPQVGT